MYPDPFVNCDFLFDDWRDPAREHRGGALSQAPANVGRLGEVIVEPRVQDVNVLNGRRSS
jgi:hypothetical protein